MEIVDRLDELKIGVPSVVTVGVFDGVHLGHQAVMRNLKLAARDSLVRSVVITFNGRPEEVVRPEQSPNHITTLCRKLELIRRQDVDVTIVLPLDPKLLSMPAEDFVMDILHQRLCARALIVGANFRFGKGREGNVRLAHRLGKQLGFDVQAIPPVEFEGIPISSTRIRNLIAAGDIKKANDILGHRFVLEGTVIPGEGIGRELGYPTANIQPVKEQIRPASGVYAVRVDLDGSKWPGVANLGTRPTVGGRESRLEVYIIGYSGNIYDRKLDLEFLARLRDEIHFPDVEHLKYRIAQDVEETLQLTEQEGCNRH